MAQEVEEVDIIVSADIGLKSLGTIQCSAFSVPGSFMYPENAYIGLASPGVISSSPAYLGVYNAVTKTLVTSSNAVEVLDYDEENECYPFLYVLDNTLRVTNPESDPGFIFAFFKNTPPAKYRNISDNMRVTLSLRVGATLGHTTDCAWTLPVVVNTIDKVRLRSLDSVSIKGDGVGYSHSSGLKFEITDKHRYEETRAVPWVPLGLSSKPDIEGKNAYAMMQARTSSDWNRYYTYPGGEYKKHICDKYDSGYDCYWACGFKYAVPDMEFISEDARKCGFPGIFMYPFSSCNDDGSPANTPLDITNGGAVAYRKCLMYEYGISSTLMVFEWGQGAANVPRVKANSFAGISYDVTTMTYPFGEWPISRMRNTDLYALGNGAAYLVYKPGGASDGINIPPNMRLLPYNYRELPSSSSDWGTNQRVLFGGGVNPRLSSLTLLKNILTGDTNFSFNIARSGISDVGMALSINNNIVNYELAYASTYLSEYVGLGIYDYPVYGLNISPKDSAGATFANVYGIVPTVDSSNRRLTLKHMGTTTSNLDIYLDKDIWTDVKFSGNATLIGSTQEEWDSAVTMPYVFTRQRSGDAGDLPAFDTLGTYPVYGIPTDVFFGNYINIDAGQPLAVFNDTAAETFSSTNGDAVAVNQTSEETAWSQLMSKKYRNLYTSQGWGELLSFPMPSNWVWDDCSIKPEGGVYKLCGRVVNGCLEWQFGNLVEGSAPSDTGDVYRLQWNAGVKKWESVVVTSSGEIVDSSSDAGYADVHTSYTSMLADAVSTSATAFTEPMLRWAGATVSKANMLDGNGKLKVSCEPIYLGMFNVSGSYLAKSVIETLPSQPGCEETCSASEDIFYKALTEVSPVWFLFASIRDGLINLVAIEHKIDEGEPLGIGTSDKTVTNPYELYGAKPIFNGKRVTADVPPGSYGKFNIWKYTNLLTPEELYVTFRESPPAEGYPAGWYYSWPEDGQNGDDGVYYPIPDSIMEAKCYRVPCPRWMEWHSVIDDTSYPINIALCQFNRNSSTGDIEVVTFRNKSLSNRGFIDNTLSREYRWQKYGNTWAYASYTDSEYVASLSDSSFTGTVVTGTACLPLGFRYSKSYAGYANQTLAMTVGGRCVRFEQQEIALQGGSSPYIEQDTYYIVDIESPVYSSTAFAQLDKASSLASVDKLSLPTGSLFVYDTLPDFNLEQFTVPAGDIGDGTIMVRKEASYEFENKNIIIIEGESSVGTVSEFTFGVGILHGPSDPGTVYMGPVPGGLHSSYTGTLVLQYEFRLGVTYDPMYNSSLKSFSRIVMDNARMTIRNADTDLNNIEVLGGEVGILKMDSVSSTSIAIDLPEPSDFKWIPGSVVNSGATGSNIGKGVLTAEGIANLVSEIGRDNPGGEVIPNVYDLSGWFAGTGQNHSFDAYGKDISIPASGAYGINSFSFKSRPALSGEYVVLGVSLKGSASRIALRFSTDNRLGYSLWQYNASTAEATCLIDNTYVADAREVEAAYDDDPVAASQLFVVWTANNPNGAAQGGTGITVSDIEISYTNASSVGASEYATLDVASVYLEQSSEVDVAEEVVPTKFALESSARASVTINKLYGVGDLYIQNQTSRTKYYIDNSSGEGDAGALNGTVYISATSPTTIQGIPASTGEATPVNFDSLVVCQGGLLGGVGSSDLEKSYVKAVSATLCNGAVIGQAARLLSDKLHAGSGVTLKGTITADSFTSYGMISVTEGCQLNVTNTFLIGGTISIPSNASTRVSINSAVLDLPCSDIPFEELISYDSLILDSGSSVTLTNVKDSSVINYTGAEGQGAFKYIIKNDNSSSDVLSIEELSCSNSSVNIYKTANGSYLFKDDYIIPDADNSSVTCISVTNSADNLDTYVVVTLGESDMYVSPEDWMHPDGEEDVSEYYLEKFESVDNAVEVERSTITCCDPFPEDCCELGPGSLSQECTGCGGPVIIDPEDPNEEEEEEEGGEGGGGEGGGGEGGGGGTDPVPQYYADVYYCQSSSGSGIAIQAKKKPGLVVAAKGAGSQAPTVQIVLPDGVSMEYIVSYLPTTISDMTCEARGSLHFNTTPSSAAYNYPSGGNCTAGEMLYGVNPELRGAVPLGADSNVGFNIPVVYKSAHRGGAAPQSDADVPFWLTSIKLGQLQVAWDGPVTTFTSNVKPVLSGTNTFLKYKIVNTVTRRYRVLQGWLNLTFNYLEFEKASGFDEAVKRSLSAGMSFNGSVSCSGSIEGDNGAGGGAGCSVTPAIGPTVTASQGGGAVVVTPTVSKGRALAKAPRLVNAVSVQPVKMEINGVLEGGASWDYCCSGSSTGRTTPTLSGRIYANLKITN